MQYYKFKDYIFSLYDILSVERDLDTIVIKYKNGQVVKLIFDGLTNSKFIYKHLEEYLTSFKKYSDIMKEVREYLSNTNNATPKEEL